MKGKSNVVSDKTLVFSNKPRFSKQPLVKSTTSQVNKDKAITIG
jgi:hypothetical protein